MSSDTSTFNSGGADLASVSIQSSSVKIRSTGAGVQTLPTSARQADKSGSSGVGPSAPTKRHPSTQGTGSKTSPKSQASTVGTKSASSARRNARTSKKFLVEGVWVDVWGGGGVGGLNPGRPSAKSTTASQKKVEDRPRKDHYDLIQCFNNYGILEDEGMAVEATRSHSSS